VVGEHPATLEDFRDLGLRLTGQVSDRPLRQPSVVLEDPEQAADVAFGEGGTNVGAVVELSPRRCRGPRIRHGAGRLYRRRGLLAASRRGTGGYCSDLVGVAVAHSGHRFRSVCERSRYSFE